MTLKSVVIASGGTGGHVLPAQMLAKELETEFQCQVRFCGYGLERFLQSFHEKVIEVPSAPFFQKNPIKLLQGTFRILYGTWLSLLVLKKHQPDVVVGFGSYHSFPVLLAAYLLRKKIVLFEANCALGRVNRFFAKKAVKLTVQFPLKNKQLSNTCFVPHLPWGKNSVMKNNSHGLNPNLFTLLVFGGSQGAHFLNQLLLDSITEIKGLQDSIQIIHLTGSKAEAEKVRTVYRALKLPNYVENFNPCMSELYEIADLAICRAGANTIAELIRYELPALLVPYPYASENHQLINAQYFSHTVRGGAHCLQSDLNPELLMLTLSLMIDTKKLDLYRKNLQTYKQRESLSTKRRLSEIVYNL